MRRPLATAPARRLRLVLAALAVAVGAPAAQADTPLLTPWTASAGDAPPAPWHVVGLPGQSKPFTRFTLVAQDGQRVLKVDSPQSYGTLVHPVAPAAAGAAAAKRLAWRWRLDEPLAGTDLRTRSGDDSPAKVCAMFDLPLDAVPFVERQLLKVARARAGEPLPAATVCYVWDAKLAPGTVLDNAYTRRIRLIVARGPEAALHAWVPESHDVQADFLRLFADEARGVLPPLVGIGIAADSDNTQGHGVAHVGAITLE